MSHQCRECGKFFTSVHPFDLHRIGKHGKDRRCMTTDEMLQAGMAQTNGIWRGKPPKNPRDFSALRARKST
jgi:hypothetical protein